MKDAGGVSEPPLDCNMQWTEIKNTKSKSISPIKINSRVFFCQKLPTTRRGAWQRDACLSLHLGVHGVGRRRWSVHRKQGEGGEVVKEDEAWLGQCELMEVMGQFGGEGGVGDRERQGPLNS